MNHYELLYIISNTYTEEQQGKITGQVESLLKKEGGSIKTSESLGKKKLSYPIDKIRYGYYQVIEFDYESSKINALNRQLRLMPEILRFLAVVKKIVIAKPKEKKKPEIKKVIESPIFKKEPEKEKPKGKKEKVSIEELDKKLDEILRDDIVKE